MKYWKASTYEDIDLLNLEITQIGTGALATDPFNHELIYNEDTGLHEVLPKDSKGNTVFSAGTTDMYSLPFEEGGSWYLLHIDEMRRSSRSAGGYQDTYCDYVLATADLSKVEEVDYIITPL